MLTTLKYIAAVSIILRFSSGFLPDLKNASKKQHLKAIEDLRVPQVIVSLGQLSSRTQYIPGINEAYDTIKYLSDSGLTSFDLPSDSEYALDIVRRFKLKLGSPSRMSQLSFLLTWEPNESKISRTLVSSIVDNFLMKMGFDSLDLLQLRWNRKNDISYVDALYFLSELRDTGKIRNVGTTSFDVDQLDLVLKEGIKIETNQVHYNLLNRNNDGNIIFCADHQIAALCNSVLLGGILSDNYLDKDYNINSKALMNNFYYPYLKKWGGADGSDHMKKYRKLINNLNDVANKYSTKIENVACRWVLDQMPQRRIIASVRFTNCDYNCRFQECLRFTLDREDMAYIDEVAVMS